MFLMQMVLQIPDSLHHQAMQLVQREQFSLEQLMLSALAEKLSAIQTDDLLAKRAQRGSRDKFQAVLAKIKSTEPEDFDRL
jgi:hypothetical protein